MTLKVTQGYQKWHSSIGHISLPITGLHYCSNNVAILHHFQDITTLECMPLLSPWEILQFWYYHWNYRSHTQSYLHVNIS